ncbi:MAG: NERD domain-containing protein [Phycisphaerales bacterium]|nr:NERD domain-containing protein [Phycisphaerales bacterium]
MPVMAHASATDPLLTLAALALGLLLGFVLRRQIGLAASKGEALVANEIEAKLRQPHVLINNVTLPTSDGTSQIDHILVCRTGVYVIETKHYQGWIFGEVSQPRWMQVLYRRKSQFQNPLRQNQGHVRALKACLKMPGVPITSLVVFTGKATFKTPRDPAVLLLHELVARLLEPPSIVLDETQMACIVGHIEMARRRRSLETDEYHLNFVRSRLKAYRHHGR